MNLVILKGRLTKDPEVRYAGEKNMAVAKFSIACQRAKKEDGADFINCTAFGKQGEFAEKYLHKGTEVAIQGHWQTGNYTNKDGVKVYTNDCVIDKIEFCGTKAENAAAAPVETPQDDFVIVPENVIADEIPFG